MRNIRILVEFASVVMPGAVLLLLLVLLFAPWSWLTGGFINSAFGITAGLASSFAAGHLLQGFSQLVIERIWARTQLRCPAEWAILRFAGQESRRYLTAGQIEQLELQYPAKLGINFPQADEAASATCRECVVSHAEAFLYSAKVSERLDDLIADYKLNKGLFAAFALVAVSLLPAGIGWISTNAGPHPWLALAASLIAGLCSFTRMEYHSRKYAQSLYLQFLTTPGQREGGGGRGEGGGGGGGGLPIGGFGRGGGAGARGQAAATDEDNV